MFFYSLPTEAKLDIFKCFNYEQLSSIKQTNLFFRDFINNFEGKLAREELFNFTIDFLNNFKKIPHKYVRPEAGNFDFVLFDEQHKELNKQIDEMWSNGQQKRIPLYLPDHGLLENIVISLSIGEFFDFLNSMNLEGKTFFVDSNKTKIGPLLFLQTLFFICNIEEHNIILELPTIIRNKKQMKIVYHYLTRLFNCSFVFADFGQFIFNPELIQLFFENATIPGKFYVINNWTHKINSWMSKPTSTDGLLKFILDNLVRETFSNEEIMKKYRNILFLIIMRGDKFNEVGSLCDELTELYNFYFCLYGIEMSMDCPKMVANIKLNDIYFNLGSLTKGLKKLLNIN
ncbi:unnamed protein product [Meloidogyne enterolobii]|uniref:Uncharacterized protein n=1 Tax=Meloidogyne enterolobii TaxID=390850 RepID=A0ACB0YS36_MELEN